MEDIYNNIWTNVSNNSDYVWNKVRYNVWNKVSDNVRYNVWNKVTNNVSDNVWVNVKRFDQKEL